MTKVNLLNEEVFMIGSDKNCFPTRITLSGLVGSGKTTIGKILAERLNYDFRSIGNVTRKYAAEKGMTIVEFQKYCSSHPEMDLRIDEVFSNECNSSQNLIIDYRLGFKFVTNAYHIYLSINEQEATERLKKANRAGEGFETVSLRNESFKSQFLHAYGVDYTLKSNYDLIIDVQNFSSPENIADSILRHLNLKNLIHSELNHSENNQLEDF